MTRGILKFDGGSRGNPGPAASAYVLTLTEAHGSDGQRPRVIRHGKYIGETTNNVAEYMALINGVNRAADEGVQDLSIFGDSLLVISHLNGDWKCKSEDLKPLLNVLRCALKPIPSWTAQHVRRKMNTEADQVVNSTLDAFS